MASACRWLREHLIGGATSGDTWRSWYIGCSSRLTAYLKPYPLRQKNSAYVTTTHNLWICVRKKLGHGRRLPQSTTKHPTLSQTNPSEPAWQLLNIQGSSPGFNPSSHFPLLLPNPFLFFFFACLLDIQSLLVGKGSSKFRNFVHLHFVFLNFIGHPISTLKEGLKGKQPASEHVSTPGPGQRCRKEHWDLEGRHTHAYVSQIFPMQYWLEGHL